MKEEARKRDRGGLGRRQREEGRDEIECSKSWRVIVLSSCAPGGAVSSLMEKE